MPETTKNQDDASLRQDYKVLENPAKLRLDFIGMVFTLAITQVGLEIGDFFSKGLSFKDHPYVFTHLALTVYIIASSWVGWQISKSKGSNEKLKHTFGLPFVILIIDLSLVIAYFVLVKGVDKPSDTVPKADSYTEYKWSLIIFIIYLIWDFFTKYVYEDEKNNEQIKRDRRKFLGRGYQSFICILITIFVIGPMTAYKSSYAVMATDLTLIFVFVLFRGLKLIAFFEEKKDRVIDLTFWNITKTVFMPIIGITISWLVYYHFR